MTKVRFTIEYQVGDQWTTASVLTVEPEQTEMEAQIKDELWARMEIIKKEAVPFIPGR